MGQLRLHLETGHWQLSLDGDADCRAIFHRHYSRYLVQREAIRRGDEGLAHFAGCVGWGCFVGDALK